MFMASAMSYHRSSARFRGIPGSVAGRPFRLRSMAHMPYVVALNRAAGDDNAMVDDVRRRLDVPSDIAILPCDATDKESVKNVLLALLYAVLDDVETQAVRA